MCVTVALAIVLAMTDTPAMVQHQQSTYEILTTALTSPLTFIDINECEESTDSCSHSCRNTPGSFRCGCNPGYELSSDNRTCQG